uniref:EF-hand domain-containing protein n=1 Tax=Globisporangium ultimum (strain ATCC 200006 / CBS 805.95 / DAOM BR144) TaxID=431595 RepID=K3XC49_GLOUD
MERDSQSPASAPAFLTEVSALRKEFQVKEKGLSISEFVFVMMRFVQSSPLNEENSRLRNLAEHQLVANLCELFAQIDINGDGSMEWEEFTSFIVETGLTVKSHQPNSIQHYHHVPWEDASKHSTFIDHIYYFPTNDVVALIENCSPLLKIYNVNCELTRTVRSPEGFVQCAEHIPKYDQFVLASSDLQFRFYDDTTLRLMKSCHTPTSQNCLKWYPESTTLFSAGVSGIVYAWDAERMEEKHHMGGEARGKVLTRSHDDIVLDLLNLPTLESLASASMDRTIRLWDVHTGKHKQQLDGHTKGVRALAYSPEYRFLVSAGFDFDALVWNPYVDQLILRLHGHNNSLCGVEIIPDTPQIVTADVDGVFKVWDIRNFACMQTFSAENVGDVKKIISITSQKRIVAAGKKLTKFDYEKLENPELTDDHPVFAALYNPTSLSFITAAGKDVKIWDARLGKLIRVYRGLSTTDLTSLCLDFRERKFIVGDHAGNIHVFDYLNGSHMKSFAYPEVENRAHISEVSRVCYCDEHMSVISASWDCCIDIHDESDSERGVLLRRMIGGHAIDITAICFSFNLSLIASASSDNSLQIWDYEFGRLEGTCVGHVSGVLALHFLDPFPILLSSDSMGNLCFWGMRPCRLKWKCLYRLRNQRGAVVGGGVASVTCITIHTTPSPYDPSSFGSYLVITGDDKGTITVWNVLTLLVKLDQDFNIRKLDKPVDCPNPQRNLRVNASGMVRKFKNGPDWAAFQQRDPLASFFFLSGTPLFSEPLVPCIQQWKAHDDVVYSIQMIAEPKSVITSSFDRRVKIWALNGECLGILTQGELESSIHKRPWKFTVDYDARERRKESASSEVIEEVHKLIEEDGHTGNRSSRARERRQAERAAVATAAASISSAPTSTMLGSGAVLAASLTPSNQEVEPEANVLEEIHRGFLPPILPPITGAAGLRKTPRRKPVTAASAGKSQFVSPRQLRLLNRAGMSSPR